MPGTPGVHAGRRSLLLLALLATITSPAFATRWDPVSPEDLASGRPGQDPAAGAVVLFSRVWVDDEVDGDDLRSVWVHYVRIKVLTAEAAQELASQQIRFEDHSRVTEVEARTIQPDGRVTPMPPQAVSKETRARVRGRKFKSIRFAPPEIRAGCIVEYRWRQVFDDALLHYATFDLQMEDLPAREIRIHLKPLVIPRWAQRQMTFGTLKPSTRDEGGYFVWEQRDVPGFHEEPFMPPERHVRPWLMVAYVPSARRSGTHYWAERGKEGAEFFDDWCRSGDALREVAREVTAGASNDLERLERLARWCRAEFHAHVPDRDTLRAHHVKPNANASAALRQRAGTLQDLDLLFAALARCAGFEVRYAAVPDRRDVRFTQALTEAAFLSSYQVAVRVDGGWRSFDPQGRWLPWDMVPIEEEGQLSLVCDRDSTFFLETPIAEPERSARARLADLELEEDGDLVGEVRFRLTGHWNQEWHDALEDDPDTLAVLRSLLDWDRSAVELTDFRSRPVPDEHDGFEGAVHVRLPGHAAEAGDRLLVQPSAWWSTQPVPFTAERRRYPVQFPFAWTDVDSLRMRLPGDWKVESLPAARPAGAEGVASYRLAFESGEEGGSIRCDRHFQMGLGGNLVCPRDSYDGLRQLFDLIADRDRLSVPLVRRGGSR